MAENCNECSIAWIRGGEYAEVSAHNGSKMKGRVLKLTEQHPEDVKILATNKDGSIFAHVPVKYVKLRAPRELTEEQRAELIERGKRRGKDTKWSCGKEVYLWWMQDNNVVGQMELSDFIDY